MKTFSKMTKLALLVVILLAPAAQADQVNLGFGPSLDSTNLQPHVGSIQYEKNMGQLALVGSVTEVFGQTTIVSVIPCAKIVTPDGMFLRMGVGLALITNTTDRLSSIPEFNIEAAGGLSLGRVEMGVRFDHFSNANPVLGPGPNLGQDAAQLHLGYRFGEGV